MSILIQKEILYFLAPEIKPSGFGKLVRGILKKHTLAMKVGSEDFPLQKMDKLLSVALMIKVLLYGMSTKRLLCLDFLLMITSLRLCCLSREKQAQNSWIQNSWNINSPHKWEWMLLKNSIKKEQMEFLIISKHLFSQVVEINWSNCSFAKQESFFTHSTVTIIGFEVFLFIPMANTCILHQMIRQ